MADIAALKKTVVVAAVATVTAVGVLAVLRAIGVSAVAAEEDGGRAAGGLEANLWEPDTEIVEI